MIKDNNKSVSSMGKRNTPLDSDEDEDHSNEDPEFLNL